MKMMKTFATMLFLGWMLTGAQAQEQFERLYRSSNQDLLGLDIVQTPDQGYLLLSLTKSADSLEYKQANLTKFEPKGDVQWSKNYDFKAPLAESGSIALLDGDSIAFSILFAKEGMNKAITIADANGEVVRTNVVGQPEVGSPFTLDIGAGTLLKTHDNGLALFDVALKTDFSENLLMTRLGPDGNLLWTRVYESHLGGNGFAQQLFDAQMTPDTGFILSGLVRDGQNAYGLMTKLDSMGTVVWGRRYLPDGGLVNNATLRSVAPTPDSGFVAAGSFGNSAQVSIGWVMKTDSIGRVVWAYAINQSNLPLVPNVTIQDLVPQSDGSVVVSGVQIEALTFESVGFALKLNPDGQIEWQYRYYENQNPPTSIHLNDLEPTQDGGAIAAGFVREDNGTGKTDIPYLLKMDKNGETSCQDSLFLQADSLGILTDSLFFNTDLRDTIQDFDLEAKPYNDYSVPVLALTPASFCEGDPILHVFDATVPGAVSYEWNTGDTTAMITATEEGMYTVIVRVEEDICYTLCDTSVISVIGPPMASIVPDPSGYCATGQIVLNAQGGAQFEWSTGETAPAILVDELGTYSVTVTDQCGTSVASVAIDQFPTAPQISVSGDVSDYCLTGTAVLTAQGVQGAAAVTWAPVNETGPVIPVTDLAPLYTVTADFGFCGTVTADIQLTEPVVLASIAVEQDSFCTTGAATLTAIYSNANSIEWNTGEATDMISVSGPGTYSFIAKSPFCDDATAEITLEPCISPFDCVQIPNAFTPDNDNLNENFWPVIPEECADIEVVEMTVYSRWGEKVFESRSPNNRWDGNFKGEPAASDVYVYIVKLVNGAGEQATRKGEVTLLR
ncbi:MAG: gliding motility-associated C-terminal domain-containing protein [Bacteroidetes bacterium]|nr:MAG: gliding motility-associated C-terminal domain-containing protein [Bacteroidota bacterium]